MTFLVFLWQAGAASSLVGMLPILAMFVVFYFFMVRPQLSRQKAQVAFQTAITKGDDVVTSSGIIGKVNSISGNIVTLQIADKVTIKVLGSAISKEMTDAYSKGQDASVSTGA
jgi:preprotein translocase subunit YajC